MTQDWEYKGTNLTTYAYNVQLLGTGAEVPARRGENIVVPGKTGRHLTTSKPLDERRVSLAMWVKDVNPSTGGSASESQLLSNLDTLRQVFSSSGTGLLKHTMGGTARQAAAEVVSSVAFEPFGTAPYYRYVVEFSMANPFWRAETARTATGTITSSPQNVTLVNNGTYRCEDGTVQITGQIVDPKFTIGDDWVQYTGTVSAGGTLVINCGSWVATNGTVDVSGDISHDGDLVWLPIPVGTAVTMVVTGSSIGTAVGGVPVVTISHLEAFI